METPLTPIMVTELRACVTDHGAPAVMEAITIAVGADTRTLRYVKGVLNRRRESTNGLHVNGANGYVGMTLIRTGDDND